MTWGTYKMMMKIKAIIEEDIAFLVANPTEKQLRVKLRVFMSVEDFNLLKSQTKGGVVTLKVGE